MKKTTEKQKIETATNQAICLKCNNCTWLKTQAGQTFVRCEKLGIISAGLVKLGCYFYTKKTAKP